MPFLWKNVRLSRNSLILIKYDQFFTEQKATLLCHVTILSWAEPDPSLDSSHHNNIFWLVQRLRSKELARPSWPVMEIHIKKLVIHTYMITYWFLKIQIAILNIYHFPQLGKDVILLHSCIILEQYLQQIMNQNLCHWIIVVKCAMELMKLYLWGYKRQNAIVLMIWLVPFFFPIELATQNVLEIQLNCVEEREH